jgi:hypothetical protein
MKYASGGLISQIATAATETKMLMRRTMNVPRRAFRAFEKKVERKKLRDMAVLIHKRSSMIMGPGEMVMISILNARATRRKISVEIRDERKKSM